MNFAMQTAGSIAALKLGQIFNVLPWVPSPEETFCTRLVAASRLAYELAGRAGAGPRGLLTMMPQKRQGESSDRSSDNGLAAVCAAEK